MEKYSLEAIERAKLCYLRNAGNVVDISEELGLPVVEVKELVAEFRNQEDTEVATLIANTLMREIIVGSSRRKLNYHTMLKSLESTEKPILSVCCNAPVRPLLESGPTQGQYECLKCFITNARVTNVPKASIYKIKVEILEQLREEDLHLVTMAEKMGFTNKTEGPTTVVHQKNNVLILGEGKDRQLVEDYSKLTPMDRERLLEKLRKEIFSFESEQQPSQEPRIPTPGQDPF